MGLLQEHSAVQIISPSTFQFLATVKMFPLIWQNLFCRCEPTKALEITKLTDPGDITVSLQEEVEGRIQARMGIYEARIKVGVI